MNFKNSTLLLAAAAITVLNFQSCSKYEDGPAFSLRTKKGRLVGDWELVKINGQNPETYMSSSSGSWSTVVSNVDIEWEFESDGDWKRKASWERTYNSSYGSYGSYTQNVDYVDRGEWEWDNNKEEVEIEYDGYSYDYDILKLSNSELVLDYNDVQFKFEKK
jgi:hypothetical protein